MKLTKQQALDKIEELKKYVEEEDKKSSKKLQIKSLADEVLYESEKTTIKEAVEEAVVNGAYLGGANLGDANLRGANLRDAEFMHAKFIGKGGSARIKQNQVDDFFNALGVIVDV